MFNKVSTKRGDIAVSPVVSVLMVIMIVMSAIGTVLFWGIPYMDKTRSKAWQENTEMQFISVASILNDLAGSMPGDTKTSIINAQSISVDGDKDRTLLSYSYKTGKEFVVTGFNDEEITVKMIDEDDLSDALISIFDTGETCFLEGTKILMADGSYKNIENINVGDEVLSYDENSKGIVSCRIASVFHHSPEEMTDYYLVINKHLRVTPNHRFYSDGKWVYAGDLKVGDPLFSSIENSVYRVYSIVRVYERATTFDLEVERCHNYFVSIDDGTDVLVHNRGALIFTSPLGGEKWEQGSRQFISWSYEGDEEPAEIYLMKGSDKELIDNYYLTVGENKYYWEIPIDQEPSEDYQILIRGTETSALSEKFSIVENQPKSITVVSPNGGENWQRGTTKTITWTYTGNIEYVKIELYRGENFYSTIAESTSAGSGSGIHGSGGYAWFIPANHAIGNMYKIKITETTDPNTNDFSNNYFTITEQPKSITVTAPNGGENWQRGTTKTITWTYTGTINNVKIELYLNGAFYSTIIDSTPSNSGTIGSGSYTWPIPANHELGSFYKVKITDTSDASVTDSSNNNFEIIAQEQLHEGADCDYSVTPVLVVQPNIYRITLTNGGCSFTGTMCIDLYNTSSYHIGIIWIFDSESISYKVFTNTETQEIIIENGGIIYSSFGDHYTVKRAGNVYDKGNNLAISIIQLFTSSKFSSSGNNGVKVRMNKYLYSSNIMETTTVYDLRLQFLGDHQEAWLEYYNSSYQFEHDSGGPSNSLLYTPSSSEDGAWFNLADSIIRFKFE